MAAPFSLDFQIFRSSFSTRRKSTYEVGILVPVNAINLEEQENSSIPKIPLSEGLNYVGRGCIPVTGKRLSQKHITLSISVNGSAEFFVLFISHTLPVIPF